MTEEPRTTPDKLAELIYHTLAYFKKGWSKPKSYRQIKKKFGSFGEVPSHQAYVRESINLSYFFIVSHLAKLLPHFKYHEFAKELELLLEHNQEIPLDIGTYNDYESVWNDAIEDEKNQLYMLARRAAERSLGKNKSVEMNQIIIFHVVVASLIDIVKAMRQDLKGT